MSTLAPDGQLAPGGKLAPDQSLDEIFAALMHTYSVSDSESALADSVEAFLRACAHLEVRRHGDTVVAATHFYDGTSHANTSHTSTSRVILAGHIDVVPVIENFPPRILRAGDASDGEHIRPDVAERYPESDVVWGRGATDMKASDAAFLYLARELDSAEKTRVDVTYVFYDHEEVQAEKNGLGKVVAAHPEWVQADFAIIGEPTNTLIEGGCNGTMRFDVLTHGVAAHSARAWMGRNAIHAAADVLRTLADYEPATVRVDGLEYREGLNATMISGGEGTNIIPQECRVHVNYRFAPDKTIHEAKALLMGEECARASSVGVGPVRADGGLFAGYDIDMKDESAGARPGLDSPLVDSLVARVRERSGQEPTAKFGWTDVARFSELGIPAVNLGAGDPLLAHKADEQVALQELHEYTDLLCGWLSENR
ncbi:succinyl-diaminopimelate desuccinylase [Alloscardovia macacae]|uniref:Succinyl-diaminopimelate desuccinylase n=1 Tax=Alloscardovia macacae TaxID=1160091 RepID=A0A1Y2SWX4_9BIFI|nr:succinyl-diaminopimelate desuccinylase [Alloscardovia macacae]OTA26278.1 succinyl-diaminopimelate desuccinylase [Alloscardovia macacae]OTA28893.1 succinyl-diaminopimelate desuccinylase [Alloscardovia macacae]